ncbi:MAG: outer membrane lipoprotein-sorting protein [Caldisericaceae bacterium]|nr:outer membrane lipoprotein-sorting protein [Caldisericaceae bacterium]
MRNISILLLILVIASNLLADEKAREIVKKANDKFRGKSSYSEARLTVIKPNWTRSLTMKIWALEPDYALILITKPACDKGTVTLKRKREVWNWIPTIRRLIKIPPSMMMQSWMGSDFTNDDLVRESSMVDDYFHKIIGQENINGYDCFVIESDPKPDAGVVWGKIISWISKKDFLFLKSEYYDEDVQLVKTMFASKIKKMDDRVIPTHLELVPANKPGQKTILEYIKIDFNININPSFFSQQNMKRVR